MIPLLTVAVPALVKLAEGIFSKKEGGVSQGSVKKDFVMKAVEFLYDATAAKWIPDFPTIDEKKLFMRLAEVLLEECVTSLKA